jgi:superfamily I DNA/RNA helicase/RecB family exonuclease
MLTVVESSSAADRFLAAADFVWSFPRGSEILLIGPSREAIDELVHRLTAQAGASFGWHRFTLLQLASLLAQPALAEQGLVHASELGSLALVARTVHGALHSAPKGGTPLSCLEPVTHFPGFIRALASTLTEVRLAGIEPSSLQSLADPGPDLATLLKRYAAELREAQVADRAMLLAAATEAARAHAAPLGVPVLLVDVVADSQAERALLGAVLDAAPDALATLPTGDDRTRRFFTSLGGTPSALGDLRPTDEPAPSAGRAPDAMTGLERIRRYLFDPAEPPHAEGDDTVRFFSAPGEQRECVEIARAVLREAELGVRFDEIAILIRSATHYALPLQHALQRAGIPAYFAAGTTRPDPAGRAFLALLQCKVEGLSAQRFAEYLSFGQVPTGPSRESAAEDGEGAGQRRTTDEKPRAAQEPGEVDGAVALAAPWRWEELLGEAAVIGGIDRWHRRLTGLAAQRRVQMVEVENRDPESARVQTLRREIEQLQLLADFALPVIETLAMLPEQTHWGAWIEALSALAPGVLHRPERVLSKLAELQGMAEVGPVALSEVVDVLSACLSELEDEPPSQRYGRVFVASPEAARGRIFRIVFVPGLAERIFPQRPREDPLLIDSLRAKLAGALSTQAVRSERERLQLRLAVGAATERLYLSYPRVEVLEGRARVPSFYGLDLERARSGALPDFQELEQRAASEANARLAWPAPEDPAHAVDDIEHDLAVLGTLLHHPGDPRGRARYLLDLNPCLGRSLRTRWMRWETRRWTPADGIVRLTDRLRPLLELQRPRSRPYGVSALQHFAACPYRFYLSAILGLSPRETPAALERIDPLTKGRLIHAVQAALFRTLQSTATLPLTAERLPVARSTLDRVLDEISGQYRDDLAPAIARVWHDEIEAIRTDLHVWLDGLSRSAADWQPVHFELGFGLESTAALDPGSRREPVSVEGDFLLRGAVDLIERRADGSALRVTDHKTGADRTPQDFIVAGGAILQPVLYSLAVERLLELPVSEARLSFCTAAGGFSDRTLRIDSTVRRTAVQALELVDRAIASGMLAPAPRREKRNGREETACDTCEFHEVCGPHEPLRIQRKDPALLSDLLRLRGLP